MRTPAQNAELALLLEVAGTPKPGNVDREREYPDLRFEHFLAGAVGARDGLDAAADGAPVGEAFESAVEGMSQQRGGNTQFGALLLLTPLVRAAEDLTPDAVTAVVEDTTVEDAANFYRAFDHVDVFAGDLPADADALDVRRGSDAVPEVRERGLTLYEVIAESADRDGVAREWVDGFERTFRAADRIADGEGPVPGRAAETFLWLLSRRPDTFVAKQHGPEAARSVMVRAQEAREDGPQLVDAFAESLVESGVNPGTTADIVAAGLFVALERDGIEV
ncbi:triphosphoribosyl-dephospho-CoA synthase [Halostella sp. JP-L12]|uniref:triphosphoribosyl-dephospho-CoA synthase n=1 Tax=Halostella TaxID=1843185 RepID=UPI000EF80A77|nr:MULTISPECIES: triphosphoribosyl-dephospho-CoA synthase [Halostella]NHN48569.1 triphosphoribosyl-dephospho-CoA synthase [Halostella sp. JP-L12]